MRYPDEISLNVHRQFVQYDRAVMVPFVLNTKITVHGFVIAHPDIPDLFANVRFVLQIRAVMAALV